MEETDQYIYDNSLKSLRSRLKESISMIGPNDRCFVIALSRKGTRMLEMLVFESDNSFTNSTLSIYGAKVITELSLPLFFKIISEDKSNGRIIIKIVDDAIYFGSTILSIYNEIAKYVKHYRLEEKVVVDGIYAAIKSQGSIDLKSLTDQNIFAEENIEKGYSHYFVKKLTHDFRGMCNTLEYEFPILECNVNSTFDVSGFESQLKERYGEKNTYRINSKEGIDSFNIVLKNQETSLFNKIRIYYGKGILRIVPMSPCPIYDNYEMMGSKMSYIKHPLAELWAKYYQTLKTIAEDVKQDEVLFRNTRRSMVILYNYLLSLYNFDLERNAIKSILMSAGASHYLTLNRSSLYCLFADMSIVNEIAQFIDNYFQGRMISRLSASFRVVAARERSPLMVESNCVLPNRIKFLDDYNRQLLSRCTNVDEALSAMLFNQTVILESYSRAKDANGSRLRFGYTYDSIYQELDSYFKSRETGNWNITDLHRWIDIRIDNGCMVPQYIVSTNNNQQWERVFRPGENEDVLLSHLSRYALKVLSLMNPSEDIGVGDTDVLIYNYERMLAYTFYCLGDEILSEESFLDLYVDDSLRLRFNDGKYVVDYLCDMSVLRMSDKMIGIHSRLLESDVYRSTTFSKGLNDKLKQLVETLHNKCNITDLSTYRHIDYTEKFNFYMREKMNLESVKSSYIKAKDFFLGYLSDSNMDKTQFEDYQQKAFDKYREIIASTCIDELLLINDHEDCYLPFREYWNGLSRMFFFMNLIYAIKCFNKDTLRAYSDHISKSLSALDINDLFQETLNLCGEDGQWSNDILSYICGKFQQKLI